MGRFTAHMEYAPGTDTPLLMIVDHDTNRQITAIVAVPPGDPERMAVQKTIRMVNKLLEQTGELK